MTLHGLAPDLKRSKVVFYIKNLSTMKNIYVHTQDEDLEIARKILPSSNA